MTVINEPFVNTELIKSLYIDSDISQPNDVLFGKILSSLLGTLNLQQGGIIFYETNGNKTLSQTKDTHDEGSSLYLPSIINNKDNDYFIKDHLSACEHTQAERSVHSNSFRKSNSFPVEQENQILDYNLEDINRIVFLLKEVYNYLLHSVQLPKSERIDKYLQDLNTEAHTDFIRDASPLLKDYTPQTIERIFSLWQTFKDSKDQPLLSLTKTAPPFIPDQKTGYSGNFYNEEDYSTAFLKNDLFSGNQLIKTPILPPIKEVTQLFNTFSLNDLDISDFSILTYTKPGDEGEGIKEIKSFLNNTNIGTAEELLTTSEDITKVELSRDKEHEHMSNFNKFSGTENTFFSIENNNGKAQIDFEILDKPHNLLDKQDNLYTISKKGDASIEISIEPDGIGEIDIELILDNGVINAQINASDIHGIEFFEKNLDNIMRVLINEGLNIGDFSVSLQNKHGMAEMYNNKREDIQNIRITKTGELLSPYYNENLISIFV